MAFSATPAAQKKTDQDNIQGTWQVESVIEKGKAMPADMVKGLRMEFKGNRIKTTIKAEGKEDTKEITFKLDPTKNPKWMDVDIDGKMGTGIYSLEGDTLKICHGEIGDPRPTEFSSKEGSKTSLAVMKRVK
jgi:uncharacterized protein (TIGR03067 family)